MRKISKDTLDLIFVLIFIVIAIVGIYFLPNEYSNYGKINSNEKRIKRIERILEITNEP